MVVGVLGVAGSLLLGGLLLYAVVTRSVDGAATDQVQIAARGIAALVDAGQLPDPIPQSGAQIVQVLDAQNRVVGASLNADRLVPLVPASDQALLAGGGGVITVPGSRAAQSGNLRVAGVAAGTGHSLLVVVALPTGESDQTAVALGRVLLVSLPIVLLAMSLVAWRVIGAALRPVEDLRAGAERIGADPVAPERLPVPASDDEIAALARTLNSMLDRQADAHRRQRDFVADAAHELRSPLATMQVQLEVAERVGDGGQLPAELAPELARLTALVEDLLTLARAGDDRHPAAESIPVVGFLREVADRYAEARVPVVLAPRTAPGATGQAGEEPTAYASRNDLLRAGTNLVDNAVRHAATRVTLDVRRDAGGVEVTVTDDGNGIAATDRERVFDRFARLDEARDRDAGGSGLGLPIARELVRRNGGRIRLADAEPGLRASVRLPAAPASAGPG